MKVHLRPIYDQCVVLFGATSGIGLETALYLVEKGARVAVIGRSQEGINDAVLRIRDHAETSRMLRTRSGNGKQHEFYSGYGGYGVGAAGTGGQMPVTGPSETAGQSTPGTGGQTPGSGPTGTAGQSTSGIGGQMPVTGAMGQSTSESSGMRTGSSPVMEEQVIGLEADVTNWEQVRSAAEQVVQRFGRIDTWVNIAAVSEWALFEDTSPEEFKRIIDVNLVGHAYGAMAALPYMKQQMGGSLIFVSSIAGKVPVPYQSAYNASKHGIIGLAETLRLEAKHTGLPISVTAVLPGSINTPLFNKARTKLGVEPEPIPPIYEGRLVAKAIGYAATHPVRELIVGDSAYMMTFMRRLAPTLTSNYMGASGFRKQRSNEPKSAQAPDNMFEHISGYNQAEGEFAPRTRKVSPLTWLSTHPEVRLGLMGALITGLGFLVGYRLVSARSQRRNRFDYRARMFLQKAAAFLAAIPLLSNLPMFQRPSFLQRVGKRIPMVGSRKTLKDRLPQGKLGETVTGRLPSRKDVTRAVEKMPVVKRREKAIDKLPFTDQRRELAEKMPFKK